MTVARARRWFVALALLGVVAAGCGGNSHPPADVSDDVDDVGDLFSDSRPAEAPFEQFREASVVVDDEKLLLLVAATGEQRAQGLRGVEDLGAYDGMAFVYDVPTTTGFTMADTLISLDIGFYDSEGSLVDRLEMEPCPDAQEACPVYRPGGSFRVAIEMSRGELPDGGIAPAA